VRFCAQSVDVFVSCGADGSVRMFDLRSLEHSTIIYEPSDKPDKNGWSPFSLLTPATSRLTPILKHWVRQGTCRRLQLNKPCPSHRHFCE
jgi:hypothetical protein